MSIVDFPTALLPCPFCGAEAKLHRLGNEGSVHGWVQCQICDASIPWKSTFEAAVAAWNRRT